MKDLFVAMPCYDRPCRRTHHCIVDLMCALTRDGIPAKHDSVSCCNVPVARNKLVTQFLDSGYSRLLFIDADNVVRVPGVVRLAEVLDAHQDVGLVGGNYVKADGTEMPLCSPKAQISNVELRQWMSANNGKAVDAYSVPTGCMLIRREVFEKVPRPWFELKHCEDSIDVVTSDYVFCQKVRAAGFRTLAHLGVKAGHIGELEYTLD